MDFRAISRLAATTIVLSGLIAGAGGAFAQTATAPATAPKPASAQQNAQPNAQQRAR